MRQYNLVHIRRVVSEVISDNPCPNAADYSLLVLNIIALILGLGVPMSLVSLYSHKKVVYKNATMPVVAKTIIS